MAAAFLLFAYLRKLPGYYTWSGLFFYFFLDDSLQFHETVGGIVASNIGFEKINGLRAQDFGELSVYASVGLLFFIPGIIYYFRSDNIHKKIWRNLFSLVVLLVVFGVGFDMLHQVFDASKISIGVFRIGSFFGAMEDFGEIIVMSLCAWYALVIYNNEKLDQI